MSWVWNVLLLQSFNQRGVWRIKKNPWAQRYQLWCRSLSSLGCLQTEGVAVNLPEPDGLGLSGLTRLKLNVGFQQEFSRQTAINSSFQSIKHEQKHPVCTRTELVWWHAQPTHVLSGIWFLHQNEAFFLFSLNLYHSFSPESLQPLIVTWAGCWGIRWHSQGHLSRSLEQKEPPLPLSHQVHSTGAAKSMSPL